MNHHSWAALRRTDSHLTSSAARRGWTLRLTNLVRLAAIACAAAVALGPSATPAMWAQAAATGAITGRVQDAATGSYLNNARVRVAGSNLEAFTNQFGEYRLNGVPSGQATLVIFYTGLAPQTITVTVPPNGAAQQDVSLRSVAAKEGEALLMSEFVVQSQRETNAAAIAINEQRFAVNRKDVVSTDAFGEINQGNIGEFVKFLPGIALDVKDGNTPSGIMVRGFDPNYTSVTIDGGQLASTVIANTQDSSRQFVLEGANINNLARIEVAKLPTPDMSANLLGGAVNFVSRSAFERPRRELRVSTYLSANEKTIDFEKTPGPLNDDTYKVLPSFDLQFVHPVNSKFGYVVSAQRSSQFYLQNRMVFGHQFEEDGATLENPFFSVINTNYAPNRSDRTSGALTFDYKPWENHVLSLKLNASANKQQGASRSLNYNVGGNQPRSWDPNNTFGAASGGGGVGMSSSFQERHALTRSVAGSWTYNGTNWNVEAAGTFSHSNNRTRDTAKGFFRSVSVSLPNVATVNLEDIDVDAPRLGRVTVLNSAGQEIDELNLANWRLTRGGSENLNAQDTVKEARVNVTRSLSVFGNPLALKFGGAINDMERDLDYTPINWTYVGPNGIANDADNSAAPFVADNQSGVSPGFGLPGPQWIDPFKVYQSFVNNPSHWSQTVGEQGDVPRNQAIRSPWLHETVTAGYLMGDLKLMENRLRLVGGVRYELTEDEGRGFLQSPDAVLEKDAQGNILDTDPARPGIQQRIRPELAPSGSAAYNSVLYTKRGFYDSRDYDSYHPSAAATYNITENLLLRAGFAKTIGRPALHDIVPTLNVSENLNFGNPNVSNSNVPGFISGGNTGLRPWTAKNYDYSIEYYLPRNGQLMFNWYRKDIRDFHSTVTVIADQALLDQLDLSSDALGYQYTRRINISDARIEGWEANLNFPLANLAEFGPLAGFGESWVRHFSIMANFTHLQLSGSRVTSSDWKRYIPRGRNFGLSWRFPKLTGNILMNWRGKMLRDDADEFPDANEYIRARTQVDASLEYQITDRYSAFVAGRNIFNAASEWEVSGPGVPSWSTLTNHEDYGAQYSLGVRAVF